MQSVRATTWRAGRAAWWTTLFLLLLFVLLLFPGVDSLQLLFKIVLSLPCWLLKTRFDSLHGSLLHVIIVGRHPCFSHFLLISDFLFFLILLVLLALFILFLFLLLILIAIATVRVWTFLFLLIFLILLLLELGSLFIAFIIRFFLRLLIFFLFTLLLIDLNLFCFTIFATYFIFIELMVFEWNALELCLICSEVQFTLLVWSHTFITLFLQSLNQCIRVEVHDLLVGSGLVIFSFSEIIHYGGSWFFVHANSLLEHVQSPRN